MNSRKSISFVIMLLIFFSSSESFAYSDVNSHWADKDITIMSAKGILGGFSNDTFKPDAPVTRAQFAKIAAFFEGASSDATMLNVAKSNFDDLPQLHWAKAFVLWCKENGIMKGLNDTLFGPEKSLTRVEASVIFCRMLNLQTSKEQIIFKDSFDIPAWAMDELNAVVENGIMGGYEDGTFRPLKALTRAELAALLNRIADLRGVKYEGYGTLRYIDGINKKVQLESFGQKFTVAYGNDLAVYQKHRIKLRQIALPAKVYYIMSQQGKLTYLEVNSASPPTSFKFYSMQNSVSESKDTPIAIIGSGVNVGDVKANIVEWKDYTTEGVVDTTYITQSVYGNIHSGFLRVGNSSYDVIVVDSHIAGVYDTVYVDSKPLKLFNLDRSKLTIFSQDNTHLTLIVSKILPNGNEVQFGFDGSGQGTSLAKSVTSKTAPMIVIKVITSDGQIDDDSLLKAMQYSAELGARVIFQQGTLRSNDYGTTPVLMAVYVKNPANNDVTITWKQNDFLKPRAQEIFIPAGKERIAWFDVVNNKTPSVNGTILIAQDKADNKVFGRLPITLITPVSEGSYLEEGNLEEGGFKHYFIDIPTGTSSLVIKSATTKLYLKRPDGKLEKESNFGVLEIANPSAGRWEAILEAENKVAYTFSAWANIPLEDLSDNLDNPNLIFSIYPKKIINGQNNFTLTVRDKLTLKAASGSIEVDGLTYTLSEGKAVITKELTSSSITLKLRLPNPLTL